MHKCWVKLLSRGRRQVTGSFFPCSQGHLGNGVAVLEIIGQEAL